MRSSAIDVRGSLTHLKLAVLFRYRDGDFDLTLRLHQHAMGMLDGWHNADLFDATPELHPGQYWGEMVGGKSYRPLEYFMIQQFRFSTLFRIHNKIVNSSGSQFAHQGIGSLSLASSSSILGCLATG